MFIRSSKCDGQQETCGCVNVAIVRDAVIVTDEAGNVSKFDHFEWRDFIAGAKAGEFDLPADSPALAAVVS
ncbi:DUF397 domain-containing protein [Actinomadura barringtoniae]|uniref:DUF397 domain-containing protein n=1 Tax=Actinomadura barringtoniae TaxID=1427535 RepID=A0A939T9W6_9ACTN|nr:DUF397 domain-containing protein [Actinomadura barringtoniae]